jgi:predicted dehydrogenase
MFTAKSRWPLAYTKVWNWPGLPRLLESKNGVVQDKLFLPGLRKLKQVIESGFLGRILSVRREFGYWVFEGTAPLPQRPSWNYRKEDGGGIILDMFPHWQYVLENLFGSIRALSCLGTTHIPLRFDETGTTYNRTADDAAYATFEIEGGVIAQMDQRDLSSVGDRSEECGGFRQ